MRTRPPFGISSYRYVMSASRRIRRHAGRHFGDLFGLVEDAVGELRGDHLQVDANLVARGRVGRVRGGDLDRAARRREAEVMRGFVLIELMA